jgi:Fe2+ transport system protein FeoA
MKKRLVDLNLNENGIVVSLDCGKNAMQRLLDMGLTPGTKIKVTRKGFFRGPVGITLRNSSIAIGYGLASKILVELNEKA